ncbi:unnamed protein product [Rotaria socialis]|uniref:Uncharacterized protein n=1 Tax=Rotaria socialis TaxID=392032 RepID=A0A818MU89_9BILA|nr:unnamed protein product [Rotaria socialis]CAF4475055.1 unnamed protein product [Rotaria socialis]
MFSSEVLNEITEDPRSDLDDDPDFDDGDIEELQEVSVGADSDHKDAADQTLVSELVRSPTAKSLLSSALSDGKRSRAKQNPFYSFGSVLVKRDPAIESIIESRKYVIIENPYTRLSQVTSQAPRPSDHKTSFEIALVTESSEFNVKDRNSSARSTKRASPIGSAELDSEEWVDGFTEEFEKETMLGSDKPCVQIYEETCARLNISPCSMIARSLNTTEINLRSYGLGPRGCSALAASLVRNTVVVSLNLSANNIGSLGMSYVYQILTENISIEDYDLSFNNLGTKGIHKLADGLTQNLHTKTLSVAGNNLNATDIKILLSKLEDHPNMKNLNLSHNQLDEEGGKYLAQWLVDNHVLLNLDISWCSIRLLGAKALAKAIGDNNKLVSLNLSSNSFTNDTIELITQSLSRNMTLYDLNLHGNQFICRYDMKFKENPSDLTTGKESQIYKMMVAAATNQSLKTFECGQNHIDTRCLIIMLEALSELTNISLEELDLTGLSMNAKQTSKINSLFLNHRKLKCYIGPVRYTAEHFANYLLNLIHMYCEQNAVALSDMFNPIEGIRTTISTVTHEQFLDGLRRARIPIPMAYIDDIIKYLGGDSEPGTISLRSIDIS